MTESLSLHLLQNSPLPVMLLSKSLSITYANFSALELFGHTLVGHSFDELLAPEPLPKILFESTGAVMNVDSGAEIRQMCRLNGNVFTASIIQHQLNDEVLAVYVRNISQPIDYWSKLHKQKNTEDYLTRSTLLQQGDFQAALREIAAQSAETLHVERVNIWMIDDGFTAIRSIMNYDRISDTVLENIILSREELPQYFSLIETENIIVTVDSENDLQTRELSESYIRKLGIKSMLDVPVRIAGRMVGLICFEEMNRMRVWDVSEQKFALSIAQLLAQALETHGRNLAQAKLEETLAEKKLLLREVNHRVSNNFTLINDMIRLKRDNATDEYHRKLFDDLIGRIASLSQLHRQLYQSDNISLINFRDFLIDMAGSAKQLAFREDAVLTTQLDNCLLPLNKATLCAVIVNELLLNSGQHAFAETEKPYTVLRLVQRGNTVVISVTDNGIWIDSNGEGSGLQLVEELSRRLGAELVKKTSAGTEFTLTFTVD
jgi:two-component sensor histidine kinase